MLFSNCHNLHLPKLISCPSLSSIMRVFCNILELDFPIRILLILFILYMDCMKALNTKHNFQWDHVSDLSLRKKPNNLFPPSIF